jgi:uncharacterized protein (TIGR02266 family)
MADDRRRAPRARVLGARVKYETKPGERQTAQVFNLGNGGLFIKTDTPLPTGKRLWLEIEMTGELAPWTALGRVLWIREHDGGDDQPAGMGVTFVDIDDDVRTAIDRVVSARRSVKPPAEGRSPAVAAPARERTVLGVGLGEQSPAPASPIVAAAPPREKTVLGVGLAVPRPRSATAGASGAPAAGKAPEDLEEEQAWEPAEPPHEPAADDAPPSEVPTAVVAVPTVRHEPEPTAPPAVEPKAAAAGAPAKASSVPPQKSSVPPKKEVARETSISAAGVPKRGRAGWVLLLFVAAAAGAGFAFRDRLAPLVSSLGNNAPAPTAAATANPSATASAASTVTAQDANASAQEAGASAATLSSAAPSASASSAPSAVLSAVLSAGRLVAPPAAPAAGTSSATSVVTSRAAASATPSPAAASATASPAVSRAAPVPRPAPTPKPAPSETAGSQPDPF